MGVARIPSGVPARMSTATGWSCRAFWIQPWVYFRGFSARYSLLCHAPVAHQCKGAICVRGSDELLDDLVPSAAAAGMIVHKVPLNTIWSCWIPSLRCLGWRFDSTRLARLSLSVNLTVEAIGRIIRSPGWEQGIRGYSYRDRFDHDYPARLLRLDATNTKATLARQLLESRGRSCTFNASCI